MVYPFLACTYGMYERHPIYCNWHYIAYKDDDVQRPIDDAFGHKVEVLVLTPKGPKAILRLFLKFG